MGYAALARSQRSEAKAKTEAEVKSPSQEA